MPKKYNLIAKNSEEDGDGERVLQGYDGILPNYYDTRHELTKEERLELAEFMIDAWGRWAEYFGREEKGE